MRIPVPVPRSERSPRCQALLCASGRPTETPIALMPANLWPDGGSPAKALPAVDELDPDERDHAASLLSASPSSSSYRGGTAAAASGIGNSSYQREQENELLKEVIFSQAFKVQMFLTIIVSVGLHILISWGMLTNWNDHFAVKMCLFEWAHPAGYSGAPTCIAQTLPVDSAVVAFVVCLLSMKRIGDVQRGLLPHVPPSALHRGPLVLLFPSGTSILPRLSPLLGVTFVWGALWAGLGLVALTIAYAAAGGKSLCMSGTLYIALRTTWGTVEAALVSAGSFLLWCSKGDDVSGRSLVERARLRREADNEDARARAIFFGWFQAFILLNALVALGYVIWTWYFAYGGLPGSVWFGTIAVVLLSFVIYGAPPPVVRGRPRTHAPVVRASPHSAAPASHSAAPVPPYAAPAPHSPLPAPAYLPTSPRAD